MERGGFCTGLKFLRKRNCWNALQRSPNRRHELVGSEWVTFQNQDGAKAKGHEEALHFGWATTEGTNKGSRQGVALVRSGADSGTRYGFWRCTHLPGIPNSSRGPSH